MPRVLVVDGELHIQRLITNSLERAGYVTRCCGNGVDALRTILEEPPDLVVLTTRLPGMSGHEVLEELRTDPATRNLPVVLLSWRSAEATPASEADRAAVGRSGCPYLIKPFNPADLVQLVRSLTGS